MRRLFSLAAGLSFSGHVLQQRQQQGRAIVCADPARRKSKPALAAPAVVHPLVTGPVGLAASGERCEPLAAPLLQFVAFVGTQAVGQVLAQHLVGTPAQGLKKCPVGGHHHELVVLHGKGLGRVPEQANQLAGDSGVQRRRITRGVDHRAAQHPATAGHAPGHEADRLAVRQLERQRLVLRATGQRRQHRRTGRLVQSGQRLGQRLTDLAAQQGLRDAAAIAQSLTRVEQQQQLVHPIQQRCQLSIGRQRGMARQQGHVPQFRATMSQSPRVRARRIGRGCQAKTTAIAHARPSLWAGAQRNRPARVVSRAGWRLPAP